VLEDGVIVGSSCIFKVSVALTGSALDMSRPDVARIGS
jgi:hypothetical protein